jgi:hypothetical protein
LAQSVATNGIYGTGTYSNTVVVGKFLGAQMSAMAATPPIGLIDHLPDAELNTLYPTRCVVIAGNNTNFTATCTGLPDGMSFDAVNGWIGNTPSTSGVFIVTVSVTTSNSPALTKNYPLLVTPSGVIPPPHSAVDTVVSPATGGTTTGDNVYTNGTPATVTATANAGYGFLNWTENGVVVSTSTSYHFTNSVNQSLVANFGPQLQLPPAPPNTLSIAWLTNFTGYQLQQNFDLHTANWVNATSTVVNIVGTNYQADIPATNGARFFRLMHQ